MSLAEVALKIANVAYLAGVIVAAAATVGVMYFGGNVQQEKDDALTKLKADTAKATENAEALRADNLSLQTVLLRRHAGVIGLDGPPKAATWFAATKAFAGEMVFIQVAPDAEAQNLATEIAMALNRVGGVNVTFIDGSRSGIQSTSLGEGISVSYPVGKPWTADAPDQPWFKWAKLSETLAAALTSARLGVLDLPITSAGFVNQKDQAPGMIPYFDPPLTGVYLQVGERPVDLTLQLMAQRKGVRALTP